MTSTFENILKDLKNRIYHPVYLLFGEEAYFIDEISDYIEKNTLGEEEREFNQSVVYGRDIKIPALIGMARRYPMMANYQVIIVKEAQDLDDIEALLPYMNQPLDSTILVLGYKYGKIDKRKLFYKAVDKIGVVFESPRIYDSKLPDWIDQHLSEAGYSISAKAAAMLVEFLGNDLSKIARELEKLEINIPPGQPITEEYIERNIGISKDFNVFELQNALGRRDIFKANQIIFYFAANPRENPMMKILPLLFSYFSKLLLYHQLPDKSKNAVAAALSVNPFFVSDYQQAAKNYPVSQLLRVIGLLREYDLKSKGYNNGSASDGELLKELVYRILH